MIVRPPADSENAPAFDVDELSFAPLPIQRRSAEYATAGGAASTSTATPPVAYRKNSEAFRRVLKTAVYARSGVHSVLAQVGSVSVSVSAYLAALLVERAH